MASADFDQNYQPINGSYPSATGTSYTVQTGDTLYQIAARVWGDASLWYLIADANGLNAGIALTAGQVLSIPNKVTNVHNSSSTFKPYDAGAAMGDTSPTLPTAPPPPPPPSPKKKKGGFFKRLVSAIVAALVAYYAPVLLPMISGYGALTIAAAAAIGNAAGQVTANALGVQSGFSWTSLATATLSAGITNGLGDVARNTFGVTSEFGNLALNSAVNNVVYQGVANLTGQQSGFSWSSVAVSAIAAPLAKGLTGAGGLNIGNPVGVVAITSLVSAATRVAIVGGKLDWQAVAVDTLSAMAVQGIGPRTSSGASGSASDDGNKQPNEIAQREEREARSGPPSSGSPLESIQQTVPGYADAEFDAGMGWQSRAVGDRLSVDPGTSYPTRNYANADGQRVMALGGAMRSSETGFYDGQGNPISGADYANYSGPMFDARGVAVDAGTPGGRLEVLVTGHGPESNALDSANQWLSSTIENAHDFYAENGAEALRQGNTFGYLLNGLGSTLTGFAPQSVQEIAVGAVAGPLIGKGFQMVLPAIVRAAPVLGRDVGALFGRESGLVANSAGLRTSTVVSSDRAEAFLIKHGVKPESAASYIAELDGPITARIVRPGEDFLRYFDAPKDQGSFLTKTVFDSPESAARGLNLEPFGNRAAFVQPVTSTGRTILLEAGIKDGGAGVRQYLIYDRSVFQFGNGVTYP